MLLKVCQLGLHARSQGAQVRRRVVAQPSVLDPAPDQLVRVQFRRVAGEVFRYHRPVRRQELLDDPGLAVNLVAVPDQRHPWQVTFEQPEEVDHLVAVEVLLVRQQLEVQPRPLLPGTQRDGTDRRDLVASVPTGQDRRLAPRRQRASHRRRQLEARFIEEDYVGVPLPRLPQDAREGLLLPAAYGILVAFLGLELRLLAGPAQTPLEDLADMLGVVGNAEVASDHFADAGRSPQVVGPAVPGGALQEQHLQLLELGIGKARLATQRLGGEATGGAGLAEPTINAAAVDAEHFGDGRGLLSFADGFDGTLAAAFQLTDGNR